MISGVHDLNHISGGYLAKRVAMGIEFFPIWIGVGWRMDL